MSDVTIPDTPLHTFAPPAEMPPMTDPLAERVSRYSEVIKVQPWRAGEIQQLATHQLEVEARFAREHPEGLNKLSADFRVAQEANAQDVQLSSLLDRAMQAPPDAGRYNLPMSSDAPEAQQQVAALRTAMFDAKLPLHTGNAIAQSLHEQSHQLERMTPDEVQAQAGSTYDTLKGMWGPDYDGRAQRLQAFTQDLARRHPAIAAILPEINLSPTALMVLSDFIEYRGTKKP